MTRRTSTTFCGLCPNSCPLVAEVEDGTILGISGDRENDVFAGYSCIKGRTQHAFMTSSARLLRSLKRQPDGSFETISVERAMDEIAASLRRLIDQHGPRSVAGYFGSMATANNAVQPMFDAFFKAIGSPMVFNPDAIDKPGKKIAKALHGGWMAPRQGYDRPEVALLFGLNPFQSYYGVAAGHPGKWLQERLRAGMQLIVVDPRVSDIAKRATLHIQPVPGEDAAILAALLHVIVNEGLYDQAFVDDNVTGVETLRRAVAPFTPEVVASRADVDPEDLRFAARSFAGAGRGYVAAGVGPSFSQSGTLVEYLILNLESLCGRWLRAGEKVERVATLIPPVPARAQAAPPRPGFGYGHRLRVHGVTEMAAGMPTGVLADEILLEGEGQVRALLSVGGNPVSAWPDQLRVIEALQSLDLLVQFDPWMSATARRADYVIAPKMPLEVPRVTLLTDMLLTGGYFYGPDRPHAQYSDAVVDVPEGSELIEEWEFFYGLAQRLDLSLEVGGYVFVQKEASKLDMRNRPSLESLIENLCEGGRVALGEVRQHPHGVSLSEPAVYVLPKEDGCDARLDVANPTMMADLGALASVMTEDPSPEAEYPFRLIGRRVQHTFNSSCNGAPTNRGRGYNPAHLHPADLHMLGLQAGDEITIRSARASIIAIAAEDSSLRRGLVSMAHGFGDAPEHDGDFRTIGSPTGRLLRSEDLVDRYAGQPRMGNVPIAVTARPNERGAPAGLPA